MATTRRRKGTRLIDQMVRETDQFDFFQILRLLERYSWTRQGAQEEGKRASIGEDAVPSREVVRLRVHPTLTFPRASVIRLRGIEESGDIPRTGAPPQLEVNFMGLTGPNAVLPDHYTTLILQRMHQKDNTLKDFLDLFHHRLLSFFYRSKVKYHVALSYEREQTRPERRIGRDAITSGLLSILGMGTAGLGGRMGIPDESLIRYEVSLARVVRPARGLQHLLSDYFQVPVEIEQFHGGWMYLSDEDLSRFPARGSQTGEPPALGINFVVGRRVYDRQSRFKIQIGPLSADRFRDFLPMGKYHRTLAELTRFHAGSEFEFDLQLVLAKEDVPPLRLSADEKTGSRLGWNSWVYSQAQQTDRGDVSFSLDAGKSGG